MAEDGEKQEGKFEFTSEGEAVGFVTIDQARFVAVQTAQREPGNYGPTWQSIPMVFEVIDAEETDDDYSLILSFRPEGGFTGTPGREQFVFRDKLGEVAFRQVMSLPKLHRFPVPQIVIGLAVLALLAVTIMFASGAFARENDSQPIAVLLPTVTPISSAQVTPLPMPTVPPVPTPFPAVTQVPTQFPAVAQVPTPFPTMATPILTFRPTPTLLSPSLEIRPDTGLPGTTVKLIGVGFPIGETLAALDISGIDVRPNPVPSTDSGGSLIVNFLIPDVPEGENLVQATVDKVTANTGFTVTVTSLSPTLSTRPPPSPTPRPTLRPTPLPQPTLTPSSSSEANILYKRGESLYKNGRFEGARFQFSLALIESPKFLNAYWFRALTNERLGQNELAITDYDQAIRLAPQTAELYRNRGLVYARLGQPLQANADIDQACFLDKQYC